MGCFTRVWHINGICDGYSSELFIETSLGQSPEWEYLSKISFFNNKEFYGFHNKKADFLISHVNDLQFLVKLRRLTLKNIAQSEV